MSDLNGTVVGIQGRDVDSAAPNDGDVYRWDAGTSKWVPVAPPQPLEPWVGTPNTQQQVIQRIPWVVSTTGSTPATFLTVSLPTSDTALYLVVYCIVRFPSSISGTRFSQVSVLAYNSGGTVTASGTVLNLGATLGTMSGGGTPTILVSVSGTDVILQAEEFGGSVQVDWQGYVDLMVI